MNEYEGVMIFAQCDANEIHPVSFEILGKGRRIARKLGVGTGAVVLGSQMEKDEIRELIYYGAEKVFWYNNPIFEDFDPLLYKRNIANLVNEGKPEIILFGATQLGRSLAPRIAAELGLGLTADCTDLTIEGDDFIQIRPAFSGNILAHIKTNSRAKMSTVRYKVMEKGERDTSREGEIIKKEPVETGSSLEIVDKKEAGKINLADASIIVSGGKGLEDPKDFELLERLANSIGGKVGSSRPLVDEGWIEKEHQVVFSGTTVRPELYIACGISGAPQHLAGMRDLDTIVAINKDPSAPIFEVADYGIVGDLYNVVPKLIEEIGRRKP